MIITEYSFRGNLIFFFDTWLISEFDHHQLKWKWREFQTSHKGFHNCIDCELACWLLLLLLRRRHQRSKRRPCTDEKGAYDLTRRETLTSEHQASWKFQWPAGEHQHSISLFLGTSKWGHEERRSSHFSLVQLKGKQCSVIWNNKVVLLSIISVFYTH